MGMRASDQGYFDENREFYYVLKSQSVISKQ